MEGSYGRFAAMVLTATAIMFALMYLTVLRLDHVFWSQTRAFMTLVMGATMAIVMLFFMRHMYKNRKINMAIYAGSAAVLLIALYLARSQVTVGDVAYMKAMIPHHSIAILTSERAQISDPRTRKLADEIIASQRREIDEMKALIREMETR